MTMTFFALPGAANRQAHALCPALNVAIQVITTRLFPAGFDIGPEAPSSYRALKAWMDDGKRLMVSNDGLEGSIYASPEINAAFRAWHDWHHYHGGWDFSTDGECLTCEAQCQDLIKLYGLEGSHHMRRALTADVVGQARYYRIHRKFVVDQMGFVKAYLDNPNLTLLREW